MDAILISGIFMSFFIVLLLLNKKNKALSDRILAIWVTIIGIHLLSYYLYHNGYWEKHPHMTGITAPFPLLHGPLLFLYTLYSLRNDPKIRFVDYFHFAPAVLAYAYMINFFFFYTADEKRMVDKGEIPDYGVFMFILLMAFWISGLTYAILSYRLTWLHKRKIDNHFSYDEGINLNWLRNCILGIGVTFLSAAIIILSREFAGVKFGFNADYIFYSLIIIFVFYLGYNGIRHQDIFTDNVRTPDIGISLENNKAKYIKSGLKEETAKEIHQKLLHYMKLEQPYLNPKLSLAELSSSLDTSPNQLSQVINQFEQVNFHDFINIYRVEEFIKKASNNKNFSYLALALDSGFNSKSSFNGIFKKHKGVTPSKYLSSDVQ